MLIVDTWSLQAELCPRNQYNFRTFRGQSLAYVKIRKFLSTNNREHASWYALLMDPINRTTA